MASAEWWSGLVK